MNTKKFTDNSPEWLQKKNKWTSNFRVLKIFWICDAKLIYERERGYSSSHWFWWYKSVCFESRQPKITHLSMNLTNEVKNMQQVTKKLNTIHVYKNILTIYLNRPVFINQQIWRLKVPVNNCRVKTVKIIDPLGLLPEDKIKIK